MDRIPEPELMDDPAQAAEYAAADFAAPHDRFVALFRERHPTWRPLRVLDLGCGPADPTRRFARVFRDCHVTGVDAADAMIALGEKANHEAGLADRISLVCAHLPEVALPERHFDTVISNSLLHHLHDPAVLWATAQHFAQPNGLYQPRYPRSYLRWNCLGSDFKFPIKPLGSNTADELSILFDTKIGRVNCIICS